MSDLPQPLPGFVGLSKPITLTEAEREAGRQQLARLTDQDGLPNYSQICPVLGAALELLATPNGLHEPLLREALALQAAIRADTARREGGEPR